MMFYGVCKGLFRWEVPPLLHLKIMSWEEEVPHRLRLYRPSMTPRRLSKMALVLATKMIMMSITMVIITSKKVSWGKEKEKVTGVSIREQSLESNLVLFFTYSSCK